MKRRGYFGIGILDPKTTDNVGTLLRSAHCFGADFTFVIGQRGLHRQASNTTRAERHVPHYEYATFEQALGCFPLERVLVAVETEGEPIAPFHHPERAVYLLGNERSGLPRDVIERCDVTLTIPSAFCLNVAVAGSIALFDRVSKIGVPE